MPNKTLTLGIGLLLGAGATLANANYTVKKGDTLSGIAARLHVNEEALRKGNGLSAKNPLKRGMRLTVPTKNHGTKVAGKTAHHALGSDTYTVREGDNDWIIANRAGIKLSQLHRLNPDLKWSAVHPGTKIHLPGGRAVAAKTPRLRSRFAVVTGDNVTVRRLQGVSAERVCTVDAGTRVTVLARDGGWYMLRFPKGTEGWVRGDLLKAVQPAPVAVHHVRHLAETAVVHHERTTLVAAIRRHAPSRAERIAHWNKHVENVQRKVARRMGRGHRYVVAPLTNGGDLITRAETFKGVRYSWGSASRSGTDCSGFTTQVFRGEGVKLPRTSQEQATVGNGVSRDKLSKGDLVFFHTGRGHRVTHVGIYMGGGKFIHASSGGGKVQVNDLSEGYYSNRFVTGRRIPKK